jgi:aspartyl-tRNA(Asn)/glutamyl-tRNA(Gln) amidotransferase subunit A
VRAGPSEALSALDAARLVAEREISAVELLEAALERIERHDPGLLAFVTVSAERARAEAASADSAIAAGDQTGPLHGVPYAVKDLEWTAGVRTTFGATRTADFVPGEDAIVVERLRAAGAILVGKTNTSEYGLLGETRNALIGETRNPWDTTRTVGGSSGGSAAAVAAGLVPVATASDTAGSIPAPSAFCGVVGLKPTRGLVPTWPDPGDSRILLDSGPMTRTVADANALLEVLAGPDPRDPSSYQAGTLPPPRERPLRIAWSPDLGRLAVDPEVRSATAAAAATFATLGHEVEEAHPDVGDPFEILLPLVAADTAALFAAAGIEPSELSQDAREELELLGVPTIEQYVAALNGLTRFRRRIDSFFERFDLMIMPATATPAFPLGRPPTEIDGIAVPPRWTIFAPFPAPWNLAGQPTASIPCGRTADGLPIGMLVTGPRRCERTLLAACAAFEVERPWPFPVLEGASAQFDKMI